MNEGHSIFKEEDSHQLTIDIDKKSYCLNSERNNKFDKILSEHELISLDQ